MTRQIAIRSTSANVISASERSWSLVVNGLMRRSGLGGFDRADSLDSWYVGRVEHVVTEFLPLRREATDYPIGIDVMLVACSSSLIQ